MPEMLVILVVALVVLGPERLPEVARQLGKYVAEFRRHSTDLMEEFQQSMRVEDETPRRAAPKRPAPAPTETATAPSPTPSATAAAEPSSTEPPTRDS